jgi:hypothetical protein
MAAAATVIVIQLIVVWREEIVANPVNGSA